MQLARLSPVQLTGPRHGPRPYVAGLMAVVLVALPFATVLSPQLTIAVALTVLLGMLTVARPAIGLCVMFMFFLVQESPQYQSYVSTVTPADFAAGVVALGVLLKFIQGEFQVPLPMPTTVALSLVAAYALLGAVAMTWSSATLADNLDFARGSLEAVLVLGLAVTLLRTKPAVQAALWTYAGTGVLLAAFTLVTFVERGGLYISANSPLLQLVYRGEGTGFNPNTLATLLVLAPGFALLATRESPWLRRLTLCAPAFILTAAAEVVLASREAVIAAGIALALGALLNIGKRRLSVIGLPAILAVGLIFAIQNNYVPWWLADRFQASDVGTLGGRVPLWGVAWHLFAQNPLLGLGTNGIENIIQQYHVSPYVGQTAIHSEYFLALADFGLIGFTLLVAALVSLGWTIVALTKREPVCTAMFSVMLIALASANAGRDHWLWVAFGILSAFASVTVTSEGRASPTGLESIPQLALTSTLAGAEPGSRSVDGHRTRSRRSSRPSFDG
jgi:O-antigen ligase